MKKQLVTKEKKVYFCCLVLVMVVMKTTWCHCASYEGVPLILHFHVELSFVVVILLLSFCYNSIESKFLHKFDSTLFFLT